MSMILVLLRHMGRNACTGHRPLKRQRKTIVPLSPDEAAAQIGQYMAGELKHEPWHAFGLGKAPIVGGNLRLCSIACLGSLRCAYDRASASRSSMAGGVLQ